jgi:hypothetical protein
MLKINFLCCNCTPDTFQSPPFLSLTLQTYRWHAELTIEFNNITWNPYEKKNNEKIINQHCNDYKGDVHVCAVFWIYVLEFLIENEYIQPAREKICFCKAFVGGCEWDMDRTTRWEHFFVTLLVHLIGVFVTTFTFCLTVYNNQHNASPQYYNFKNS